MKNIIPWGGNEKAFCTSLRKRILHATRRIRTELEAEAKGKIENESFAALSHNQRIQIILDLSTDALKLNGFELDDSLVRVLPKRGTPRGFKRVGKKEVTVRVLAQASFSLTDLRTIRAFYAFDPWSKHSFTSKRDKLAPQIICTIIASLGRLSLQSLQKAFPLHSFTADLGMLTAFSNKYDGAPTYSFVAPIGNVLSAGSFDSTISSLLIRFCERLRRKSLRNRIISKNATA